ncbi:hypothetical protein ACFQZZ_05145 [Nocardia sp. GCM10030253]|uniref:hypothetical protein n=1 Tax=Nocardia sp. GCM10030253 TaxID=3273404 RepID=UPI003642BB27
MADFEGEVIVHDRANNERITLIGNEGDIRVKNAVGELRLHFDGVDAALYLGGQGNEGDLIIRDEANKERIKLDGGAGHIWVRDAAGKERVRLSDKGNIAVRDAAGNLLFQFDVNSSALHLGTRPPRTGIEVDPFRERIKLDGAHGDISVKDAAGNVLFRYSNVAATLYLGGKGAGGSGLILRDALNKDRVRLSSREGDIGVQDADGNEVFRFVSGSASLDIGGTGKAGSLVVRDGANKQRIKLVGGEGDIILSNADAAEDFEVADAAELAAGMVMVLGQDGKHIPCSSGYDQTVVGVVSGTGGYRPGIVFDRGEKSDDHRVPISVMGKVACRADAGYGSIRVGDLLTTSPSPGCAMKAEDRGRAFGTIIGKALEPLHEGAGLVPILISLQ